MTECISQQTFTFYPHGKVRVDFCGGQISSDAGLLTLRAFDERHHLTADWAEPLRDARDARRGRAASPLPPPRTSTGKTPPPGVQAELRPDTASPPTPSSHSASSRPFDAPQLPLSSPERPLPPPPALSLPSIRTLMNNPDKGPKSREGLRPSGPNRHSFSYPHPALDFAPRSGWGASGWRPRGEWRRAGGAPPGQNVENLHILT